VPSRCLHAIELFSDLVSNAIAIGQVKEITRHGSGQRCCRTHVPSRQADAFPESYRYRLGRRWIWQAGACHDAQHSRPAANGRTRSSTTRLPEPHLIRPASQREHGTAPAEHAVEGLNVSF